MNLNIEVTGLSLRQVEKRLNPAQVHAATRSTVNVLARMGATRVQRQIRSKYQIRRRDLFARRLETGGVSNRNGIRIERARGASNTSFILGAGKPLPIVRFRVTPRTPEAFRGRRKGRGVTYTVRKGKRVNVRNAFIAQTQSGHIGAFVRSGSGRLPIRELFGPSIPQMLRERDSLQEIRNTIFNSGPEVYERELRFRLQRAVGR